MATYVASQFGDRVHTALNTVWTWITDLTALDWALLAIVVLLVAWGWVRARAFVRLGSIQIDDLKCDGGSLQPSAAKATLQQELGKRGWLPPSGVPSGSPSVAALAEALSQAPLSEAGWIGSLLKVIPWPATSTGFKIGGTLILAGDSVEFDYQLTCTGPRPSVQLGAATGRDQASALAAAAKDIYRLITVAAPEIYPPWVRLISSDALTAYRDGLDLERQTTTGPAPLDPWETYAAAYARYLEAARLDPNNLLVRLRMANCLERMGAARNAGNCRALELGPQEADELIQALAGYLWVRLREPSIFEARFRASVLMSNFAAGDPETLDRTGLLRLTADRYKKANRRHADRGERQDRWQLPAWFGRQLRGAWRGLRRIARGVRNVWRRLRGKKTVGDPKQAAGLAARLQRASDREAKYARRRLWPLWSLVRENRFRHRFEPTGRDRRQLRKGLAISTMARKARRARGLMNDPDWRVSNLRQLRWRAWVFWRYMVGRSHVAGWLAHYNAACFYALLPQADQVGAPFGTLRIRKRALVHLSKAIEQQAGELSCSYVRYEDPDLEVLRDRSPERFARVIVRLCPDDLPVHYMRRATGGDWGLHVWGGALATPEGTPWDQPLRPVSVTEERATFRVRILDEHRPLYILPHAGDIRDSEFRWMVIPAELVESEIRIYPGSPERYYGRESTEPPPRGRTVGGARWHNQPMRIAVIGATGRLGGAIAREALARHHTVTALARDPARLTQLTGMETAVVDARDPESLRAAIEGHDVVVSSVTDRSGADRSVIPRVAAALIAAVPAAGVGRLAIVGGGGSLEAPDGRAFVDQPGFPAQYLPEALAQRAALELLRAAPEGLDWTYLSPPPENLVDGDRRGGYVVRGDEKPVADANGHSELATGDLASAMLDELERPQFSRRRFTAGYP